MDMTQPTTAFCDWCGVKPAQRPNGECDDCWHLPGHEGEGEPTLEAEAYRANTESLEAETARLNRDFAALRIEYSQQADTVERLRAFVERVATHNIFDPDIPQIRLRNEARALLNEIKGE